jgi:PAS domain S-box-containing protein
LKRNSETSGRRSEFETDAASELQSLRRTLRDVVALAALPSIWADCDLPRSIQNLADVMRTALRAYTVCVRLELPDGSEFSTSASRGLSNAAAPVCDAAAFFDACESFGANLSSEMVEIQKLNGSGPLNALPHPIVFNGKQIGHFVACYKAGDLPSQSDRLLLQVAVNQIGLLLLRHKDQEERFARKLAEDRLRQAEHHYQQLLQSLPAAVYTCDNRGRLTLYNDAAVALWGSRPRIGEDVWSGPLKLFKPDGSPLPLEESPMAVSIREGRAVRGQEIIVERPDGTRACVLPHPDPICDESGKIVGTVNMLVAVDELKRAEQAARMSEARMQSLLTLMPAAVYACDAKGRITFYNRGAAELWGCEPKLNADQQTFCGAFRCWFEGKVLAPSETPMAVAVREAKAFRNLEPVFERADGIKVPVLVNIDPLFDAEGNRAGAINVFQDVTALKAVEQELRRKTEQLAAFLETAALGLHRVGPDGIILWANDAEMRMLGYSREEYIGHHIAEFHADGAVIEDILKRLTCGDKLFEYEARLKCKDGSVKQVLIDSSVLWEEGRFIHTQCFTRDITARTRAEAALRRTAEFDEAVMRGMGEGLFTLDEQGLVTSMNPAAEKMFGWTLEEMRGRKMHDVTHYKRFDGSPFPAEECPVLQVLRKGQALSNEEDKFIRKDGTFIDVIYSSSPLRDGDRITGLVVIFHDVTERKHAQESAATLAAIVEHSDDAIFSTDLQGSIRTWNAGAHRLYQYGAGEIVGQPVSVLVPEERQDEETRILEEIRQGKTIENYETLRLRKDGSLLDVSLAVSPIKDANGRIIGISKIARDITDRVRAKEKLEQAVAERTQSLREVIAQMEEFSYSVSHDLRSPVRAMQGYARALAEDYSSQLDQEARLYIDRIIQGSSRMERLIHDVLTYSRVSRTEAKLQPVSLDLLVHGIVGQYPELHSDRAEIIVQENLPSVIAHEPSLGQAFSNLLHNAVKFVAPGIKPKVHVFAERKDGCVTVQFQDNGIGIRPEHQSRLFGMFERIHPDGKYEGTGIGLAIVRKAVERMGGKVGIVSDGAHGSTFWIQLSEAPDSEKR